jgi:hypothetical protein
MWSDLVVWLLLYASILELIFLTTLLRSALEQKKVDEVKEFGAINYDAPVESEKKTIGLGTKVNKFPLFLLF